MINSIVDDFCADRARHLRMRDRFLRRHSRRKSHFQIGVSEMNISFKNKIIVILFFSGWEVRGGVSSARIARFPPGCPDDRTFVLLLFLARVKIATNTLYDVVSTCALTTAPARRDGVTSAHAEQTLSEWVSGRVWIERSRSHFCQTCDVIINVIRWQFVWVGVSKQQHLPSSSFYLEHHKYFERETQ